MTKTIHEAMYFCRKLEHALYPLEHLQSIRIYKLDHAVAIDFALIARHKSLQEIKIHCQECSSVTLGLLLEVWQVSELKISCLGNWP